MTDPIAKEKIAAIVKELIMRIANNQQEWKGEYKLSDLNINSLSVMKLFVELETALNLEFCAAELAGLKPQTVNDIIEIVYHKISS